MPFDSPDLNLGTQGAGRCGQSSPAAAGTVARLVLDPDRLVRQLALNFLPGSEALYASWTSSELATALAFGDPDDEWLQWK